MPVKYIRQDRSTPFEKGSSNYRRFSGIRGVDQPPRFQHFRVVVLIFPLLLFVFLFFFAKQSDNLFVQATVTEKEKIEIVRGEFEYLIFIQIETAAGIINTGATVDEELWNSLDDGAAIFVRYRKEPGGKAKILEVRKDSP